MGTACHAATQFNGDDAPRPVWRRIERDSLAAVVGRNASATSATFDVAGQARVEGRFPAMPEAPPGCTGVSFTRRDVPMHSRYLQWRVRHRYPGPEGAGMTGNHWVTADIEVWLPDSIPATWARVDSALRTATMVLQEESGEPPMLRRDLVVQSPVLRLERGQLHFVVTDSASVHLLIAPGNVSLTYAVCAGPVTHMGAQVPIHRR